jgi:multiple sugar transport system ATP-binding protein
VIIGIRPTDFSTASGSELKVVVDVIEPMGNELYVYGRCGDNMLSARVPEDALPKVGQPFLLKINPEKLYIFDEKTEKAI